jgi:hypothetical protein
MAVSNGKGVFLLFLLLLFAVPGHVSAHSPSGMDIGYDSDAGSLAVTLTHIVDNPGVHYVSEVEIARKGDILQEVSYSSQPSRDTFSYRYPLVLSAGDTVRVTTCCSIGGSMSKEYTLPSAQGHGGGQVSPSSAAGPLPPWVFHVVFMLAGLFLLLGVALLPTHGTGFKGWFRYHVILAGIGGILMVAAIGLLTFTGLSTGGSFFRQAHVILGILVILLLFCTFFAGIFRNRKVSGRIKVRTIHIWLGRVLVTLAIANILLGLAGAGIF